MRLLEVKMSYILATITQDTACVGRMPKPVDHNGGINTHRFCLKDAAEGGAVFDLMVNVGDLWNFERLFEVVRNDSRRPARG